MRGQSTQPIPVRKSVRPDEWRGLTSMRAGEITPIAFFPLLREDRLRGQLMIQVKMAEAVEVIVNPIRVTVHAHLIPKSALERFGGSMEVLNRSFTGEAAPAGFGTTPPWYVQETGVTQGDAGHPIYDKLGVHYVAIDAPNTDLVESYNTMVNWRRAAVSKALSPFGVLDKTLKPAFWDSWRFDHVKPSFDAAMMEGAVPVQISGASTRVYFDALQGGNGVLDTTQPLKLATGAADPNTGKQMPVVSDADATPTFAAMYSNPTGTGSISLSNIRLAEQTQAYAMMRERFAGLNLSSEHLVDLLMQGIRVPPEAFREPILIATGSAVIGQQERFATDGDNLDVSVSNGVAQLALRLNTPEVNPGGIVLVTCEIVPEQLYERTEDLFLKYPAGGSADRDPNYLRDVLDPQKVETVPNAYADQFHSAPTGVFGYAPLNHRWRRSFARVGGRYKRPIPDAFVEERQRIWAVEKLDPVLGEDFYVCPQPFPHTVFADADADPFEIICVGTVEIVGNTVIGATFNEDENSYEKVLAEVDQSRIVSPDTLIETAASDDAAPAEVTSDAV